MSTCDDTSRKAAVAAGLIALAFVLNLYRYYRVRTPFTTDEIGFEVELDDDLQKLSAEISEKIRRRQNPEDCDKARLLVYHVKWWACGLGCTTHVTLQHFLLAFYTNRTFVLQSNGWSYDQKGWDHVFMPIGKCKYNGAAGALPAFSDKTSNVRIVHSPNRNQAIKYDWKIPRNILAKLKDLHSDPYAWWIGQFINYMLRLQPWFDKILQEKAKMIPTASPTVCLHIRWGDKIAYEAEKHPVSEYMNFAKKWFERPEHQGLNKTIYVATEQSQVWKDLTDNYQNFSFIGAGYVNRQKELDYRKASRYDQRKNELEAILIDVHFLSECQYVVCTLSSNVGRLLYEIIATRNSKPQNAIQSVDVQYYWLMDTPTFQAIENYVAPDNKDDIDLNIGDIFKASRTKTSRADGYVRGKNIRTGLTGRVPMNKLEIVIEQLEFDF